MVLKVTVLLFCLSTIGQANIKPAQEAVHMIKLLSSQYKKISSNSMDQLKNDFGTFPPAPLNSANLQTKFDVIFVTKFGILIYTFSFFMRLYRAHPSNVAAIFNNNKLASVAAMFSEALSDITSSFNKLSIIKKIGFIFLGVPLLIVSLPYFLYRIIGLCNGIIASRKGSDGFFLPVLKNELEIVIQHPKENTKTDVVKSHEHLHLLQYVSKLKNGCEKANIFLHNPKSFVAEKFHENEDELIYLFKSDEVEARLHEVILSLYRSTGKLPLTVRDFTSLLMHVKNISDTFGMSEHISNFYLVRDKNSIEDLQYMIILLRDFDIKLKFLTEVLPVMYGNLCNRPY